MESQTFGSVWDAIVDTAEQAENYRLRSECLIALRAEIEKWGDTQAEAGKRLGITQPRLNDLLRGRIDKFSLDALVNLAARAGIHVQLMLSAA